MIYKEKLSKSNFKKLVKKTNKILSLPIIYNSFQNLLLNKKIMKRFVNECVCPFVGATILDIGCGTSNILEYLPIDISYVGYDINPTYIEYASNKYKGHGTFYCKSIIELKDYKQDSFDIVLAFRILHHLNLDEAKKLVEVAFNNLKRGGRLVTIDNVYIKGQSNVEKFFLSLDRGEYIHTPEEYISLVKNCFSTVETSFFYNMLKIPYTHFVMKCFK